MGSAVRATEDPDESADVARILRRADGCAHRICTSTTADRNLFDRATITWNPALRSEIEPASMGEPAVARDPTASLLHELVHAADECDEAGTADDEIEAVRIENVYRRAAGLPQRTGYGTVPLPPAMMRECRPGRCSCAIPDGPGGPMGQAADPAPTRVRADADPAR